jgi:hypothetical protein
MSMNEMNMMNKINFQYMVNVIKKKKVMNRINMTNKN